MLKSRLGLFAIVALMAGCSSSDIIGPKSQGDGNIVLTDLATNAVITSSQQNPYQVDGTFSIGIGEGQYAGGLFNVTLISFKNGCYNVQGIPTIPTGFQFVATPLATNDPCVAGTTTQALITDSTGHSKTLWFYLKNTIVLAS